MNPYLEKLSFSQLLHLFMETTKEFVYGLEIGRSSMDLKFLRDNIKSISAAIEFKKTNLKGARV
jgi:hypothetical protein